MRDEVTVGFADGFCRASDGLFVASEKGDIPVSCFFGAGTVVLTSATDDGFAGILLVISMFTGAGIGLEVPHETRGEGEGLFLFSLTGSGVTGFPTALKKSALAVSFPNFAGKHCTTTAFLFFDTFIWPGFCTCVTVNSLF